ncbi:hypothetical protein H5410_028052 [Solanum commersonii]|uniref:Uncharacterized protein n=1 Tax=Solanum commersonii TaxID=4109 RepID=A0A9J5Z3Q3_SOLCO|nr:hypothetical protein H5410_028052 [Solanum commersonii]
MNRTSMSSFTLHRAFGSILQPNLLRPRVLPFYFSVSGPWEHGALETSLSEEEASSSSSS